ncbi:hypothetical protein MNBD_CHLOROFLEXI01-1062, partial [hydrothermal vent metagenome]
FWHVALTNVEAELAHNPNAILLKSNYRSLIKMLMALASKWLSGGRSTINREKTVLPPRFRGSMSKKIDARLPEGEQGLGVTDGRNIGKFYPMRLLPKGQVVADVWRGRTLLIERGAIDGVPSAKWADGGEPMQLLSRWYGFSFTYPGCDIYEREQGFATEDIEEGEGLAVTG